MHTGIAAFSCALNSMYMISEVSLVSSAICLLKREYLPPPLPPSCLYWHWAKEPRRWCSIDFFIYKHLCCSFLSVLMSIRPLDSVLRGLASWDVWNKFFFPLRRKLIASLYKMLCVLIITDRILPISVFHPLSGFEVSLSMAWVL